MKRFIQNNLILLLVIAVGLAASFASIGKRMKVESRDKTYDIVIDEKELALMAEQSEHSETWWLNNWKEYGIDKVGVWEDSLATLAKEFPESLAVTTVYELKHGNPDWQSAFPNTFLFYLNGYPEFDEYDVICTVTDKDLYSYIRTRFEERYPDLLSVAVEENGTGYLYINGSARNALYTEPEKITTFGSKALSEQRTIAGSVIENLNLGFREATVEKYESIGYHIIPRTVAYDGFNDETFAVDVFHTYSTMFDEDPAYLIVGGSVYGYDDRAGASYDYLTSHPVSLCLIEASDQLGNLKVSGLNELSERLRDRTVRTYSVWDYIQYRYAYFGYDGPQEIQNTLYRAVTERNIRLIYFKPMKMTDEDYIYITDPEDYAMVFRDLENRLAAHHLAIGTATPALPLATPFVQQILIVLGAVGAAILLLKTIADISRKFEMILLALGVVGVIGCFWVAPNLSAQVGGFAAAVIWPCLGASLYFYMGRKYYDASRIPKVGESIVTGAALLVVCAALALIGGLTAAAPFSANTYLVEQASFRGIKISQILPMAFALYLFVAWFGLRRDKQRIGRLEQRDVTHLLTLDIKVWMALVFVVLAGVATIYIIRTGHTSNLNTHTLEVELRNRLEELLPARPRTKEFLIAFPCMLLFVYACSHKYRFFMFVFGFCAVIGLACIANTYMHLRTPVYFSLERLAASLPIGIVLGAVFVLVFHLLCRVWNERIKEKA